MNECEGLEAEYIDMADKYDDLLYRQRMATEDNDSSDEEFVAEPKIKKEAEVSETSEISVRITRSTTTDQQQPTVTVM